MNFQGHNTYQTNVGALFSIILMLLVGIFAGLKLLRMIKHDQPDFIVNTVLKDMNVDYPEPFDAQVNRFEFAVGFLSIRPYRFEGHDPRIG